MSLRDLVVAKIAQASAAVDSFQSTVQLHQWVSQTGSGKPTFAAPVNVRCVLNLSPKQQYGDGGKLVLVLAELTILDPVAPNAAAGRVNPIDPRDKFTLPDGRTTPIVHVKKMASSDGIQDPITGAPFLSVIMLGEPVR